MHKNSITQLMGLFTQHLLSRWLAEILSRAHQLTPRADKILSIILVVVIRITAFAPLWKKQARATAIKTAILMLGATTIVLRTYSSDSGELHNYWVYKQFIKQSL